MLQRSQVISGLLAAVVVMSSLSVGCGEELKIGKLKVGKVLFLGNSITLHGPAPKIGWEGNWGMAATAQEKDFVHLLSSKIATAAGGQPEVKIRNIADFERQYSTYDVRAGLKDELSLQPDLIVIAIGENVAALNTDEAKAKFKAAFADLLQELKKDGSPTIFVRSSFWANPAKDEILQSVCEDAGGIFVDNRKLGADEANYARAERKIEHAGVAAHPGDRGMQAIADALWVAIEKKGASK
ncbi:SGNH/GDSL hydrolase family protein [Anatilimnocola floriformis]|uniref:SGNH/GDSL hydrolase family protein n=1 Tax=Anatilimnocola floriformis TaxID=2948575 RepID=UPI0020C3534E|nr:SGNH/GDSL hydrolase family protein [Anatilimnocola floriformis]